jgi:UDP-N-acetylmuramoyl-L-alanyl-D-glutamate--2,6-diaminopimelate ligase
VPNVRGAMARAGCLLRRSDRQAPGRRCDRTNGKTTTAFLVRAPLEADGCQNGLLGTVKSVIGRVEHSVQRTTPEAIDLQGTFKDMLEVGDKACAMEISSHALELIGPTRSTSLLRSSRT